MHALHRVHRHERHGLVAEDFDQLKGTCTLLQQFLGRCVYFLKI